MKPILKIVIALILIIAVAKACSSDNESLSEDVVTEGSASDYAVVDNECYGGTSFPTFQSITGIPCAESMKDEKGEKKLQGYVPGCYGYYYEDCAEGFAQYADCLLEIGAKPTYGHVTGIGANVYYELDGGVMWIVSVALDDRVDVVVIPSFEEK